MPGSRRMSVTATHRHRTNKADSEIVYQQPMQYSPRWETESSSTRQLYAVQQAVDECERSRTYSIRQDHTVISPPVCGGPSLPRDLQPPQLPSLRTLIDLPPLQSSNPEYIHRRASPTSPYSTTSPQRAPRYREEYAENPTAPRDYVSAPSTAMPASYFDGRFDSRKRPISEASFRPSTRHGPSSTGHEMISPGSTNSIPPAYYADHYNQQSRPDYPQPLPTTEGMIDGERDASFQGSMPQFAAIASKRASLAATVSSNHPRCIGQKVIQGKGMCYVYDDGTYCEAVVRGEVVNPEWGLTRAGRARKRLAKACNGCREKKVKCEPGSTSRCQRCLRKGQECQWTDPPSETSPDRESYELRSASRTAFPPQDAPYDQYTTRLPLTPPYTVSSRISYEAVSSLPDHEARQSSKRLRSESPERGAVPMLKHEQQRSATLDGLVNNSVTDKPQLGWEMDPYQSDPAKTQMLLHLYFEYRDTATNCVLPRESFWRWVRTAPTRSRDEQILLYVVLGLGSLFSHHSSLKEVGNRYIHLARHADGEVPSRHSLPLALARLHLAFYYFATGNGEQSYYYVHSGFRTINALHLNTQNGVMNIPSDPKLCDFGFGRLELIECRRRVFWLGYMTERYSSFVSNISLFSNTEEDIFLHLPNNERAYQAGAESYGPLFDGGILERNTTAPSANRYPSQASQQVSPTSPFTPTSTDLGSTALSTAISQIWGDVQRHTYRSLHSRRPQHLPSTSPPRSTSYADLHASFTTQTLRRLTDWESTLPSHLHHSPTNTWRNILCGNSGDLATYLALQCVNSATRIHLARFCRWRELPTDVVKQNIRAANAAARELLALVSALARDSEKKSSSSATSAAPTPTPGQAPAPNEPPTSPSAPQDRAFANPYIAHAVLLAADTVSAAGNIERHLRDTLRSLSDASSVLHLVGAFFATAARQEALLRGRIAELQSLHAERAMSGQHQAGGHHGGRPGTSSGSAPKSTWRRRESCLLVPVPRECDIVYDVEEGVYADAMAGAGGWPDVRA